MKTKLLTSLAALMLATQAFAASEGQIDLTLNIGDPEAEQVLEVTANLNGSESDLLTTVTNGMRTLEHNIGSLSFTGSKVNTGSECKVTFTGENTSATGENFSMVDQTDANAVPYFLVAKYTINGGSRVDNQRIKPNANSISTTSGGVDQDSNSCSILINELIIASPADLTNKQGTFTDTLTYTMTAI